MSNSNKTILAILLLILIVLIVIVTKKGDKVIPELDSTDALIEEAINNDTTDAINSDLDKIDVNTDEDVDFQEIDKELENL